MCGPTYPHSISLSLPREGYITEHSSSCRECLMLARDVEQMFFRLKSRLHQGETILATPDFTSFRQVIRKCASSPVCVLFTI